MSRCSVVVVFLLHLSFLLGLAPSQVPGRATAQEPVQKSRAEKKYELHHVRYAKNVLTYRFKPTTGETWFMNGSKWDKIEETAALPKSQYEFIAGETGSGNLVVVCRFDSSTGATWLLYGTKWERVQEP